MREIEKVQGEREREAVGAFSLWIYGKKHQLKGRGDAEYGENKTLHLMPSY